MLIVRVAKGLKLNFKNKKDDSSLKMHTVHSPNSSVFLSVLELYWDPDNWPHRTASSILPPSSLPFVT